MRAVRLRYAALGLLTYVQSIGMVMTATLPQGQSSSSSSSSSTRSADSRQSSTCGSGAARPPTGNDGQRQSSGAAGSGSEFSDIASKTVRASDIFVGRVTRIRPLSLDLPFNGDIPTTTTRYRVKFSVSAEDIFKGQSLRPIISRSSESEVAINVDYETMSCVPVNAGSRYVVFLRSSPSSVSSSTGSRKTTLLSTSPPLFDASDLPEPFSNRTLKTVREYACPKCVRSPRVSLVPPLNDVTLLVGQRLKLQCRTSGRPEPLVTWFKDNIPVDATEKRLKVTNNRRRLQLQISKVKVNDSGVYQCRGRSVVGSSNVASVSVTVLDPESTVKPHTRLCTDQSYCLNGGTCYIMTSLQDAMCECKAGFEGRRCEEKRVGQPVVARESSTFLAKLLVSLQNAVNR